MKFNLKIQKITKKVNKKFIFNFKVKKKNFNLKLAIIYINTIVNQMGI